MGFLAFGLFLLLVGTLLTLADAVVISSMAPVIVWAGWVCIALGAILAVVHLAVGPKRVRWTDRVQRQP